MSIEITTERLVLRPPTKADLGPWMDFLVSPRGVWHGGGPAEGRGRAWRIVAILMGHWQIHGFGVFVARERLSQRPIGSFGPFWPADWPEREIGWSVWSPSDEGKGYATEASKAVVEHAYANLGWDSMVSYIDPTNHRSIALAVRLGARRDSAAPRPRPSDLVYRHLGGPAL